MGENNAIQTKLSSHLLVLKSDKLGYINSLLPPTIFLQVIFLGVKKLHGKYVHVRSRSIIIIYDAGEWKDNIVMYILRIVDKI